MGVTKTKWSALDTIFVLFASITILLILLWISSQLVGKETFSTLPGWATGIADKWWTFLTTGASSALLYWINNKKKNTPNYLAGIGICTMALLVSIVLITNFIIPKPPVPVSRDLTAFIRFKLDYENAPQVLFFTEQKPNCFGPEKLIVQDDGYFIEHVDLPELNADLYALANPPQPTSEFAKGIDLTPIEMHFIRTNNELRADKTFAIIKCSKDGKIELDKGDPGYIKLSLNASYKQEHSLSLFSSAMAQSAKKENKYTGWIVPNISTLNSEKKLGFSEIKMKSLSLPSSLSEANRYAYYIFVNGTPICIDGFLPQYMKQTFSYKQGINLVFGLENLGFSGNVDGFEKVQVKFKFFRDEKPLNEIVCSFDYVALRSTESTRKITANDGSLFQWDAAYKVPVGTEYEIFWVSPLQVEKARKGKEEIAKAQLSYQNHPLIGVIRPPKFPNKHYGVCVGLVLENKQIKFTYSKADALAFLSFVKKANSDAFLYHVTGNQIILSN